MNDDTVRHLWSDAELDEALAALNPHETSTDRAELDRARASLMRAAAAASDSDEPVVPQRKERSGAWRWIAVAAAVALLTGGVVVATELATAPTTLAPAGPASPASPVDRPEAGAPFTHIVTRYTATAWVEGNSVFRVPERQDLWIPADPTGTWKRRWSRSEPPELVSGRQQDAAKLPGPEQSEESAPGGQFRYIARYPGGPPTGDEPSWYNPTLKFLASLPTDPAKLAHRLLTDLNAEASSDSADGPTPQPLSYGGPLRFATINYPPATRMILLALASGKASRELRAALQQVMDKPALGFSPTPSKLGTAEYTASTGMYKVLVSIDLKQVQLTDIVVVVRNPAVGLAPGTVISSAKFSYETTDRAGD